MSPSPLGPTERHYALPVHVLRALKTKRKLRVLEVGAGPKMIVQFLPQNMIYESMDNAENFWHETYTHHHNLDTGKFPIPNNRYDVVICNETLEHVMYPERVIEEIIRVAKPNALFFFSMPNEYNFISRAYFLLGKKTAVEETFKVVEKNLHIHRPRVQDILHLFSRHFELKKVDYVWQSRSSENSSLARALDTSLTFLAQLFPSLFARTVSVFCVRRR